MNRLDHPDYVWHFKLSSGEDERLHPDALTEMVRQQLKALLGCVVLTGDGVKLRVTGFRFLADPDAEHAIYPEVVKRDPAVVAPESSRQGDDARPGFDPQDRADGA